MANKRGQVTLYIIVGIIIVILASLIIFNKQLGLDQVVLPGRGLDFNPITEHIMDCTVEAATLPIYEIALKGGSLSPASYRLYEGVTVSYLCYNMKDTPQCYNKMLTINNMEQELQDVINFNMLQCLNLNQFNTLFGSDDVTWQGNPSSEVTIQNKNVQVKVILPVTLSDGQNTLTESEFITNLNYPLGDLYEVSQDIIDVETQFGEFDQLLYMLGKNGDYTIYKQRPYPDKIYKIKLRDGDLVFQFFVEGEPGVE